MPEHGHPEQAPGWCHFPAACAVLRRAGRVLVECVQRHELAAAPWPVCGRSRRRVLVLRAAGYSYKEIAELLGVTYTNVNRQVTERRAELREIRRAA
jgi:hypothetical protein